MAHFMPPAIYAFFRPPPPLPFKPPVEQKKMPAYDGLAEYTEAFNTYDMPPPVKNPTPKELREKRKQKHMEKAAKRVKIQESKWDPKSNATPEFTGDAYKTLFVARLAYDVTEEDLRHEFEYYGPVKRVRVVKGKDGKSRGYAFVEFESGRDLKDAYADADGRKIMGRRILVDVERGRTVKNWKPRRLGGGLGGTRIGGKEQNTKFSGRDPAILTGGTGGGHSGSPPRDRREKERVERERRDRGSERDRGGGGDRDRDRDRKRERSRSPDRRRRSRTRSRSPRRDRDRDRRR